MSHTSSDRGKRLWLTGGSIAALALGFLLGGYGHSINSRWLMDLAAALNPIGTAWSNGLRLVVMPLVVAQLVYALASARSTAAVSRISALAFVTFTVMLLIGGIVTAVIVVPILGQIEFTPEVLSAFRAAVADAPPPETPSPAGFGVWLTGLVPSNIVRAASEDHLIAVLIFAMVFGFAAAQLPAERRSIVVELSRAVAEVMMTIVGWLMWAMPVAVFALTLSTAVRGGWGTLEVVGVFVVLVCAVMLLWTAALYPIAVIGGRVSLSRFARAMLPVHLVAASTRSSLASLPSLVDSAENRLGLRPDVSRVVMPLAVSTFKFSYPISSPVQFLFVAYVYGVPLSSAQILVYLLGIVLLSYASLGIPNGGAQMRAAPLYIAAGVPIEGYLLTEAVEDIPDVFKTILNVTGNMTAASLVNRMTAETVQAPAVETVFAD